MPIGDGSEPPSIFVGDIAPRLFSKTQLHDKEPGRRRSKSIEVPCRHMGMRPKYRHVTFAGTPGAMTPHSAYLCGSRHNGARYVIRCMRRTPVLSISSVAYVIRLKGVKWKQTYLSWTRCIVHSRDTGDHGKRTACWSY